MVFRSKFSAQSSGGPVIAQLQGRAAPEGQEGAEVVWLPTYADCLEAVNTGRADLTSMPASFAECLFTERSYGNVAPATADHKARPRSPWRCRARWTRACTRC